MMAMWKMIRLAPVEMFPERNEEHLQTILICPQRMKIICAVHEWIAQILKANR